MINFQDGLASDYIDQRITLLEDRVRNQNQVLNGFFVKGRLRTNRPIPVDSNDIIDGFDLLYDRVLTDSYEYIVINDSGALKWRRVGLSTF